MTQNEPKGVTKDISSSAFKILSLKTFQLNWI